MTEPPPPEDAYEQLLHLQILEGQAKQANPDRYLTLDEAGVERLAAALRVMWSEDPNYEPDAGLEHDYAEGIVERLRDA
jgi:hypothetical protein